MKKIILAFPITALCFSSSALSTELIMTDEELARVVCNHLEQSEQVKVAVSKAYSETKDIIDDYQKTTLKQLSTGTLEADNFCSSIQN